MGLEVKTVFVIGPLAVVKGMPKAFLGVPFIVGEDGQPDRSINEYLLSRRNGDWAALEARRGIVAELSGRKVLRAELNYLRARAYQLDVFRRWCIGASLTYSSIGDVELDAFAEELEEGILTGIADGLQPQFVNQYLISVIDFLRYCADRTWRRPLTLRSIMVRSGKERIASPIVMRRVNPSEITDWYTEEQILSFIGEFETAPTLLAAKIMYRMGLRIGEVLSLSKDDFPSLDEFRRDVAKRSIRVRGKFKKFRWVPIDEIMLSTIWKFIETDRRRYEVKLVEPSNLLLIAGTAEGKAAPLKARAVQKEFARVRESAGFSALSPHLMRHHYAAHFLLKAWRRNQQLNTASSSPRFDVAFGQDFLSTDLLVLKQSLGHSRLETTMKYLHAVARQAAGRERDDRRAAAAGSGGNAPVTGLAFRCL